MPDRKSFLVPACRSADSVGRPRGQPVLLGLRLWPTLKVTGLLALIVTAVSLGNGLLDLNTKVSHLSPRFILVANEVKAPRTDVYLGEVVSLQVVRIDPVTDVKTSPDGLYCELDPQLAPMQNLISPKAATPCAFEMRNSRTLFAHNPGPRAIEFGIHPSGRDSGIKVEPRLLVFHDFVHPTPKLTRQSAAAGSSIVATLLPEAGAGTEAVQFSDCQWFPDLPETQHEVAHDGCRARFIAPLDQTELAITVTATASTGGSVFQLRSNPAKVAIVPAVVTPASPAAPATPVTPTEASAVPQTRPTPPEASVLPPKPANHEAVTSAPPPPNVAALIASMRGLSDAERYDALRNGLGQLNPTIRLDSYDALAMLGTLTGTARADALKRWLLPRMGLPIAADDAVHLFTTLKPFDRVELLHDLRGCAVAPLSSEQRAQLLSGIFGGGRDRASAALATPDGGCHGGTFASN